MVMQQVVWLCNGPSGYAAGQRLHEHRSVQNRYISIDQEMRTTSVQPCLLVVDSVKMVKRMPVLHPFCDNNVSR